MNEIGDECFGICQSNSLSGCIDDILNENRDKQMNTIDDEQENSVPEHAIV